MGDDFIAKHKDRYNRSLTKSVHSHHKQRSLFQPETKETVSYPCRLNDTSPIPSKGGRLMLRLAEDAVEVLDQHQVIGLVSPEANKDVIDDFKANPDCKGILGVEVIAVFAEAKRIDVSPGSNTSVGGD